MCYLQIVIYLFIYLFNSSNVGQFFLSHEFYLKYKRSVVRTLFLRAETIITDDKDKEIELKHLKSVLQDNSYKP